MSIGTGRSEFLQNAIIEGAARAYQSMGWYTWRRVFREVLSDETIKRKLRERGLHVDVDEYIRN